MAQTPATKAAIQTAVGAGFSVVVNGVYQAIEPTYFKDFNPPGPGAWVEHAQWGLLSLIAATRTKKYRWYLTGLGIGLVTSDFVTPAPSLAGAGLPEPYASIAVAVDFTLVGAFLIALGTRV